MKTEVLKTEEIFWQLEKEEEVSDQTKGENEKNGTSTVRAC